MTITLPLEAQEWPLFRVIYRPTWGAGSGGNSSGGWAKQIMQSTRPESSGFILQSYSRALLPQLGNAVLLFRYGIFGSKIVGESQEQAYEQQQGQQWDPDAGLDGVPDLAGHEIIIQMAPVYPGGDTSSPVWQSVWWGICEYQTDEGWGASPIPSGQRTYHCIESLHRLKRWPLDSHGFKGGSTTIANAYGHPGYNVSPEGSRIQGNRDAASGTYTTKSGATAMLHSLPGAGTTWTDLQVINHLLAASRPPGEPLWQLTGATDLFGGTSSWEVNPGDTAWDLLLRIVDRGRGRGAVRCEFTQAGEDGPVTPILKAYAQIYDTITYDEPGGSQVTIPGAGAQSNNTSVEVDLIGDHRFVPGSLQIGQAEQYQVDYLESMGEPIEVLVTLSYEDGTLEKGWKDSQETAFRDLDPINRTEDKWRDVLQLHRLKRGFTCEVGDGNGAKASRCDYRCSDAGAIGFGDTTDTSPATISILDDVPIFIGYNYENSPVRYDGDAASVYGGDPARSHVRYFVRIDDDEYLEFKEFGETASPRVMPDGFLFETSSADEGYRFFYYETIGNTGAKAQYNSFVVTCALRLPHRVRMATGDKTGKRRKTIYHEGLHLWMAHPSAIWDLNAADRTTADGSPGKRAAAGSVQNILRDDRAPLARLHALAVAWYGPLYDLLGNQSDEPIRRGCSWSLRCCGDVASSAEYDGGGVIYPDVGKVVTYLRANGQRLRLMTPVSSFIYDNEAGVTTWTTDWQDLDFRRV